MVQVPSKILTLEEFLRLPETKPASEYIEGQILQKPMPQGKHSRIQGELLAAINAVVKPKRVACAFPELRCTGIRRMSMAGVQRFLILRCLRGIEFLVMTVEKLRMLFHSHLIGRLKFYRLIKAILM